MSLTQEIVRFFTVPEPALVVIVLVSFLMAYVLIPPERDSGED
jgi:hypothetical protein